MDAQLWGREAFVRDCDWEGLTPDHYGAVFVFQGDRFTLVGLEPEVPPCPFVAVQERTGLVCVLPRTARAVIMAARG